MTDEKSGIGTGLTDGFRLDRSKAIEKLLDRAISVVGPRSDADELNRLADESLDSGVVTASSSQLRFSIYPMSLVEPEPLLSVNTWSGLRLLGSVLKIGTGRSEDPVEFTMHVLEEMVSEANALLSDPQIQKSPAHASKRASTS